MYTYTSSIWDPQIIACASRSSQHPPGDRDRDVPRNPCSGKKNSRVVTSKTEKVGPNLSQKGGPKKPVR